ncbi:hypothetical protein TWF730_010460 [Orbilia blumenaviensis]|uniref:Rhodanese domain-containing protein n=1 Tax=Orbilia blumenaviensis TaxID=1796055 RepID=A0AAV9UP48_9PEZI
MYNTSVFPFQRLVTICSKVYPVSFLVLHPRQSIRVMHSSRLHNMSCEAPPTADGSPWYAAFPSPRTTKPGERTREEVLSLLKAEGSKDFVLVDLRRNDYEGGTIRGAINLPAQSLHPTIPTLYDIFKAGNVKQVIWYCGSSGGRGTRAAGWFADHIDDKEDTEMKSVILAGGIKGWVKGGKEYTDTMIDYVEAAWSK